MNIAKLGAAALMGAAIAGCDNCCDEEKVLAVNGETLTRERVEADVEAIMKAQGDKLPKDHEAYYRQMAKNQIVQNFIVEKVLVKKAKADGIVVTDADRKTRGDEFLKAISRAPDAPKTMDEYFKKFPLGEERGRHEFENGVLIDNMIKAEHAKAPAVSFEAEAKAKIAEIVSNNNSVASADKAALKKLTDIKNQLAKVPAVDLPTKFAELAKANSECPSAANGGDLNEFTHGQMVKEFDEAAFKLPVNKVSDVVKTQFGYHLILVTKKIPAVAAKGDKPAEPEKVRASHILVKVPTVRSVPNEADLVRSLKMENERKFAQEYVMKLVRSAKIEAFADDFKQFVPPPEASNAAPETAPESKSAK